MPKREKKKKPLIGFIGQGFIGKSYADDFVRRGFTVVRYALENGYEKNKDKIKECDIVFIAVPTPTTPKGFDFSIVEKVLPLVGKGKTAVIKSTLLPGTTERLQEKFPDLVLMHSPEFLIAATAAHDAAHPNRNLIGIPKNTPAFRRKANEVMRALPRAPYQKIMDAREAEMIKYGGNCFLYLKVVYMNLLYDLSAKLGADFAAIRDAMAADPRIGKSHMTPVYEGGRGAGGLCFIKDFEAFLRLYREQTSDTLGIAALSALRAKNNALLNASGKDLSLLAGVYGKNKL